MTVALLLVLIGSLILIFTNKTLHQFFQEDNSRSLQFVASNFQSNFQGNLESLDLLAKRRGFFPFQASEARELSRQFLTVDSIFSSLHVYQKDGSLLFSEKREGVPSYQPEANFYEKWDRGFIKTVESVFATGKPALTEVFRNTKGVYYQVYIVPLFDALSSPAKAVLTGAFFYDAKSVGYVIQGLKLGESNFILLSDPRGNPLQHDGIQQGDWLALLSPELQQISESLYARSDATQNAIQILPLQLGPSQKYVLFSAAIPALRLTLTLGAHQGQIDQKSTQLAKYLYAILIAALLASYFAANWMGEKLSSPFYKIAEGLDKISQGDFGHTVEHASRDEFGVLAQKINLISAKIKKARYLGSLWGDES